MRRPSIAWIFLAALYGAFLLWYDGGGGPLSPQEIERHVATFQQRGGDAAQIAGLRAFLATDPAFGDAHLYKLAALQKTIAVPVAPVVMLGSPRVLLALAGIALGAVLHLATLRRAA